MANQIQMLMEALEKKSLVKIISGIDNYDTERVSQVVYAATVSGAGAVDVAARPDIVRMARQTTILPVFASSVHPEELAIAVENGADVAEIGNFDALYKDGFYLSAEEVLKLTENTMQLLDSNALLSVTIPGHLSIESQVRLAQRLEELGVTIIQTEGASRVVSVTREVQLLSAEDKLALTLQNTQALSHAVNIPVMTASGITANSVLRAFDAGASAVGVGSAVNRMATEDEMIDVLLSMMSQVKLNAFKPELSLAS